jgi:hypothetical protein
MLMLPECSEGMEGMREDFQIYILAFHIYDALPLYTLTLPR